MQYCQRWVYFSLVTSSITHYCQGDSNHITTFRGRYARYIASRLLRKSDNKMHKQTRRRRCRSSSSPVPRCLVSARRDYWVCSAWSGAVRAPWRESVSEHLENMEGKLTQSALDLFVFAQEYNQPLEIDAWILGTLFAARSLPHWTVLYVAHESRAIHQRHCLISKVQYHGWPIRSKLYVRTTSRRERHETVTAVELTRLFVKLCI